MHCDHLWGKNVKPKTLDMKQTITGKMWTKVDGLIYMKQQSTTADFTNMVPTHRAPHEKKKKPLCCLNIIRNAEARV